MTASAKARALNIKIITPVAEKENLYRDDFLDAVSSPNVALSHAFIPDGPPTMENFLSEYRSFNGLLQTCLQAKADGFDAAVIACSFDPCLLALEEAVPALPIFGCFEMTLRKALREASKVGIVFPSDRGIEIFEYRFRQYGVDPGAVAMTGCGLEILGLQADPNVTAAQIADACERLVKEQGAEAIIFGCAGLAGYEKQLMKTLRDRNIDAPVFDPVKTAIAEAARLLRSGVSARRSYPPYLDDSYAASVVREMQPSVNGR